MRRNKKNHKESEIDVLIRELQLEEIDEPGKTIESEVQDDNNIELEFDEITYSEEYDQHIIPDNGNKDPNKFNKIMNIALSTGGVIIVILLVLVIVGRSGAINGDNNEPTADSTFVEEETTTQDIERITDMNKATTRETEATTRETSTQETTRETTTQETTTRATETTTQETTTRATETTTQETTTRATETTTAEPPADPGFQQ